MAERRMGTPSEVIQANVKEDFLRSEFIARDLEDIMAPELIWDQFIPKQTVTSRAFSYTQETISGTRIHPGTDPRKEYAPPRVSGSEFAYVTVSPLEKAVGVLKSRGIAFAIDEDALNFASGYDPLQRLRTRVAYWLAEQINTEMVTALTNNFSVTNTDDTTMEDIIEHSTDFGTETTLGFLTGVIDSGFYWDEPDADPVTDLIDLKTVLDDQDGYSYTATDVWMRYRDLNLLNKYIMDIDASWQTNPDGGFNTNAIAGLTLHGVQNTAGFPTTVGDGYIMMLDRNRTAGTTYMAFYSGYPRTEGMNYHSFVDDYTHDRHYQFWYTRNTVITEPRGLLVCKIRD